MSQTKEEQVTDGQGHESNKRGASTTMFFPIISHSSTECSRDTDVTVVLRAHKEE